MTFSTVKYAEELKRDSSRGSYLPIWWLPWYEEGAMTKLKIEGVTANNDKIPSRVAGIDDLPNPSIFFTAALSGCSVFVHGDHFSPSVYHGGSGQSGFLNDIGAANKLRASAQTSEEFWRAIFHGVNLDTNSPSVGDTRGHKVFQMASTGRQKSTAGGKKIGEVNKSNYSSPRLGDGSYLGGGMGNTSISLHVEQFLKNTYKKQGTRTGITAVPFGCVFGIRQGIHWEFFLQRNVVVSYYHAHFKNSVGPIKWGDLVSYGSVMTECFCMGLQKFFPGEEFTQLRDVKTLQLV